MTEPSERAFDIATSAVSHARMATETVAVDRIAHLIDTALAEAWDQGHRASERDFEFIWDLATPDEDRQPWTNPYRQEKS